MAFLIRLPDAAGRSVYAYNETFRDLAIEKSLAQGHLVFQGPVSSLGAFHFGPIYYYLLFPVAATFHLSLYSLALSSLLFSLATIALSYYVALRWWHNRYMALAACAVMTISILDIKIARYASNPNFIPFFSLLFFYSLERLIAKSPWLWPTIGLAISFGVLTQLHAVPLICLPIILALAIGLKHVQVNLKQAGIFVLINCLLYSPYVYFEITQHFPNIKSLLNLATASPSTSFNFGARIVEYVGFWLSPILSTDGFFNVLDLWANAFYGWFFVLMLPVFLLVRYNQYHLRLRDFELTHNHSLKLTMLYWLIVPSIVLLLPLGATVDLHIYYFFIFLPLVYFMYVVFFAHLYQKGWHLLVYYSVVIFIVLQMAQLYTYNRLVASLK